MLSDFYITSANVTPDLKAAFFGREDAVLADDELNKLSGIADVNSEATLDLIGTASDDEAYGDDTARANLIHKRVEAVIAYLREEGWKGKPLVREELRNQAPTVDSRRMRRVMVKVSADQNAKDDVVPKMPPAHQSAPTAFETAREKAREYALAAAAALNSAHSDYDRVSQLARQVFTNDVDLADLAGSVTRIADFLGRITEWKPDVQKAPTPAYRYMNYGSSSLASTADRYDNAIISFGPKMESNPPEKQRFTFLHESAHAALNAHDVAYGYRRLFSLLDHGQATTNADSYAIFIVQAAEPGGPARRKPPADNLSGLSSQQRPLAARAVAEAETFLGLTAHDVDHTYRDVWNVLLGGKQWRGKYDDQLARIRAAFSGEVQPVDLARPDDIVLTGIHNRLRAMRGRIEKAVTCVARPDGSITLPRKGVVELPVSFFSLPSDMDRVRALVVALAAADSSVPQAMRDKYAALVVASARYREEQ